MKETEIQNRIRETVTNGGDYKPVRLLSSENKYKRNQVLTFEKEGVAFKIPAKSIDKIFHNIDNIELYVREKFELIDDVSFSDNVNKDIFPSGSVQAYLGFKEGKISKSQLQSILINPVFDNLRRASLSFKEKSLLDEQAELLTAKKDFYESISPLELNVAHNGNRTLLQDAYFKAKINASENPVVEFDKKDESWVQSIKYNHSKAMKEFKSVVFKLMDINEKSDKKNYLTDGLFVGKRDFKDVNFSPSNSYGAIFGLTINVFGVGYLLNDKPQIKSENLYFGQNPFTLFGKKQDQIITTYTK